MLNAGAVGALDVSLIKDCDLEAGAMAPAGEAEVCSALWRWTERPALVPCRCFCFHRTWLEAAGCRCECWRLRVRLAARAGGPARRAEGPLHHRWWRTP